MPEAARHHAEPSRSFVPAAESFWDTTQETGWPDGGRGQVGAMHRDLERRLLAGSFGISVIPLPVRPFEQALARASRLAGWAALGGGFACAAGAVATLLG